MSVNNSTMQKTMSITSQGQITIPSEIRQAFGITGAVKAVVKKEKDLIVIKPQLSFDDLAGSLKSKVSLSDEELRQARDSFSKQWARKQ
jgi:AbrB family looped-hinge helix DNA binding protein